MKALIYPFFILLISMTHLSAQENTQAATQNDPSKMSSQAAVQWLELVDQGKFDQSWDTGSLTFKLTIPKNNWKMLMNGIRSPLGNSTSRKILEQRTSKNPKGLPKGDYMVLLYDSVFTKKKKAHELVTMIQESDGVWRVLTYQVQ